MSYKPFEDGDFHVLFSLLFSLALYFPSNLFPFKTEHFPVTYSKHFLQLGASSLIIAYFNSMIKTGCGTNLWE